MFTNRPAMQKGSALSTQDSLIKDTELRRDFLKIRDAVQQNLLSRVYRFSQRKGQWFCFRQPGRIRIEATLFTLVTNTLPLVGTI